VVPEDGTVQEACQPFLMTSSTFSIPVPAELALKRARGPGAISQRQLGRIIVTRNLSLIEAVIGIGGEVRYCPPRSRGTSNVRAKAWKAAGVAGAATIGADIADTVASAADGHPARIIGAGIVCVVFCLHPKARRET
jgi:hypothetical protein